jgi:hypothetical protein
VLLFADAPLYSRMRRAMDGAVVRYDIVKRGTVYSEAWRNGDVADACDL